MNVVELAYALHREATVTNERRGLVLAGGRRHGYEAVESVLDALEVPISATTLVGPEDRLRCEQVPQSNAGRLLGTTREVVVVDTHEELRPNALGKVVGSIDGGGLLILLTPPLESWPDRRDGFDESLAVPPFALEDVTGRFRKRLVDTLRAHRGIAVVDLEDRTVEDDGLTHPAPVCRRESAGATDRTEDGRFPRAAYEACYTADQADAVAALETLADPATGDRAVVLESDRGRGKSSAAGLAAGALAAAGRRVLVTAPDARNASELFARARELLEALDTGVAVGSRTRTPTLETATGGSIRFLEPAAAVDLVDAGNDGRASPAPDVLIVDEAAALPVRVLESLLAAPRLAFATTVHGYEGAGRGFSVRFRDRLAASDHEVSDVALAEPIRYAGGDPLEVWAFRALLLDARPPVDSLVADATPDSVVYRRLEPDDLLADEILLREAFGLLVLAHYRTEPADLARLLDAPNLEARALCYDGHVASVALLAREGNLSPADRAMMYEGGRIRGNMLPDVLTSQLRDESAGDLAGLRVVRIATHHAVRSRGLGSRLLERIREEYESRVDWLGTGFGATPGLVEFWRANGYSAIHLSTTRNDTSGEYSVLMCRSTSDAGHALAARHGEWFVERFPAVCSDALSDLEPDVARAVLRSVDAVPRVSLSAQEWRVVAGAAYGPGLFDVDPGPFRRLIVRYLAEQPSEAALSEREEQLLVARGLQGRPWPAVAGALEYQSAGQCMRSFGDALVPLVDHYGDEVARAERDRFFDD